MAADLLERMTRWLDCEEGRGIFLHNANPDFEGPSHIMEFYIDFGPLVKVFGESRDECFDQIEHLTSSRGQNSK